VTVAPGILYVVATPLGNLEDISARALTVLREVSLIAAEDTRHTGRLLAHFGIHTKLMSYHDHNERDRVDQLLAQLHAGASIALVSDAGTPGIADPGYRIVHAARARALPVVPIPGPCAIITALCAAGLPTDRFTFLGFLPERAGKRHALLESVSGLPHTLVFYVAKWDLAKYLLEMQTALGPRCVVVGRELTKQHETFHQGNFSELALHFAAHPPKGEMTVVVEGHTAP